MVSVRAPDWREGLAASLRAGVNALPGGSRGVVVFLGDMPLVPPSAAGLLIAALENGAIGAEMRFSGRPAHPVAFGRALFDDLRSLKGDRGGRHLLSDHDKTVRVETLDAGAVFDIDHVEDMARLEPWP
ncbi:Molybdopterin biosynthesis protein MoeA / CTP:molybdopterin cytidylyltransferase [Rubellimicrobium mesophilum DSM 19309]|uniref:Molybdopterin biosynthesis protein MoeA / CTP:molybdopterin cytidylyltransferase n=2 Tax=Rubellimicrobium TaxID=295418 RepID=A0A017HJF5_9RHOB|nr:Molybdopterin biosynthesis protein MoeA / CTP:molybdopterin cytidylyltransferase [Rubellimicrobium mesophilum DSM 19309]